VKGFCAVQTLQLSQGKIAKMFKQLCEAAIGGILLKKN
jgi:hypothetical protein